MADKKTNREKLNEITASIEQGIKELFQSDKYAEYLRTMSRFHSYSPRNTILIHMQRPDATVVAGFNAWKNKFSRHVKKGERGLTILAPTPFKKKIEAQKLDPVTQAPVLDRNGNIIMEEKEVEIPMFRPVKVFDVSQTEGKPLPHLASPLTGDVRNYEAFMEALRRTSPVPMDFKPLEQNWDGFFSPTSQSITLREGMSQVQTVCATVHEITHALLHNQEQDRLAVAGKDAPKPKDRNTEEVEAESVSYAVCQYYGIQTGENSFGYIASWSKGRELPELKASLETIGRTANRLITDIDRHFKEICKEWGIDLTQPEQTAPEAEVPDTPERFAADLYDFMDRLYQEGTLERSFTPDSKQQFIDDVNIELEDHLFSEVRAPLEYIVEHTGAEGAKALLARLERIEAENTQPEQAAPGAEVPAEPLEDTQPGEEPFAEPSPDVLPEPSEQADTSLDEYPMPDPDISADALEVNCGYMDGDLLPLSKDRAMELLERDFTVYMVQSGENPSMVFDTEELLEYSPETVFAVPREEWEASPDFHQLIADRLNHQEERERAFLDHGGDCFAIYQIKDGEEQRDLRFVNMDRLTSKGLSVDRANYDLAYTGEIAFGLGPSALEQLWVKFNTDHPADYHRLSMSVSDIIAVKQDGVVSCHYCDSFGFAQVPDFIKPENYLKSAEMSMEDDYGMIDGIINNGPKEPTVAQLEQQARSGQPISLMDLAAATHREEREKRQSVREKLKNQPKQKRTAPKKSAERDR